MFRQILVNEDDVEFQRIFWREIPEESLKEYRLLTVTYGTACAPYLSIRTIQQLAEEEIKKFPEASKVALEDFYVDDLITGTNSKEDAKKLVSQVIELMKKGGFPIRKWASNESSMLESLPTELRSSSGSLHIEEDHLMKILGIIWNSKEDTFRINISPPNEVRPTKRQLLSTIAKIYDSLGFLSPTTIQLKILMQDIWKENISWDDPVTDCIFESWTQFKNQMKHLAEIQIPRYLAEDATAKRVLLIGFCDASQRAYAAVFYLRTELVTGKVHVSMITSKTRVAPVKSITLPRLELLAALLLSELYVVVLESLRKQMENLCCQSYLKNSKKTSEASWHHVKSQENPADCASREDVKCEEKSSTVLTNVSTSSQGSYLLEIIAKYSSFSRLIRVIAWCKRYIKNCRLSRVTGVLTSKEVDDATKIVIQTVQESQFHSEIQLLNKKHPLPNSSKLLPLSIFLDTDGIIKVGGRLKNSSLSPIQKHPILLPKSHHLTNLVIQHFHHINLHSGPQLTLCCIRQKFWIPSGRGVVGRLLSKCQTCFRFKAKSGEQLMGNLPANRLSAGRAFLNVGIDFEDHSSPNPTFLEAK
ncbi:integrase catalytic domain-containing protein [Trichonephila clavipes]|nr:integrase catalytic domain-containing protein [Trichonephila clavipes]